MIYEKNCIELRAYLEKHGPKTTPHLAKKFGVARTTITRTIASPRSARSVVYSAP